MLKKRVCQPAPHRKVCALEFDVTRSEVFPEVVGRSDNLEETVWEKRGDRRTARGERRSTNGARRTTIDERRAANDAR
jgi:hypothetical protein